MTRSRRELLRWALFGLTVPTVVELRAEPLLPQDLVGNGAGTVNPFAELSAGHPGPSVVSWLGREFGLPLPPEVRAGAPARAWTTHDLALASRSVHDELRRVTTALLARQKPDGVHEKTLSAFADPVSLKSLLAWYRALFDEASPVLKLMNAEPEGRQEELESWDGLTESLATFAKVHVAQPPAKPLSPFEDVPLADPKDPASVAHPAYAAMTLVEETGVFTGYPLRTFRGKRALTPYEFGVSLQRVQAELHRILLSLPASAADGLNARPPARPLQLSTQDLQVVAREQPFRATLRWTRTLTVEFSAVLAMLGTDLNQVHRNLTALEARAGELADLAGEQLGAAPRGGSFERREG